MIVPNVCAFFIDNTQALQCQKCCENDNIRIEPHKLYASVRCGTSTIGRQPRTYLHVLRISAAPVLAFKLIVLICDSWRRLAGPAGQEGGEESMRYGIYIQRNIHMLSSTPR